MKIGQHLYLEISQLTVVGPAGKCKISYKSLSLFKTNMQTSTEASFSIWSSPLESSAPLSWRIRLIASARHLMKSSSFWLYFLRMSDAYSKLSTKETAKYGLSRTRSVSSLIVYSSPNCVLSKSCTSFCSSSRLVSCTFDELLVAPTTRSILIY